MDINGGQAGHRFALDGNRSVVCLWGEHDASTVATVRDALDHAREAEGGEGDLVVDLAEVSFIDAAIVGAIIQTRAALVDRGNALTVRAPSPRAHRILDILDLTDLIDPVGHPRPGVHLDGTDLGIAAS